MRDDSDDDRDDDQQSPEPTAADAHAQAAVVGRLLADPRRVRRS